MGMRNFEKIEILPSWEVSFVGMPLKLWTSLDCFYKRCPSRYFAIYYIIKGVLKEAKRSLHVRREGLEIPTLI